MEEIFKEMLCHYRHQEQQRHNFLTVVIAVFAAIISFSHEILKNGSNGLIELNVLLLFLLIISILGYFLTTIWNKACFKFKYISEQILSKISEEEYKIFKKTDKGILRAGFFYIVFYTLMMDGILFLLINDSQKAIHVLILCSVGMIIFYLVIIERYKVMLKGDTDSKE